MVKRVVLMAAVAMALLLLPASSFATLVTYSTSGVFSGGDLSGGQLANGTATVSYTGQGSTTVNANPVTGANIGTFTVAGGNGTFTNDSFMLTITQTNPVGSGNTTTTINGTVSGNSNSISLSFAPTTLNIGGITWTLNSQYFLVAPNTNGGQTTIQASLSAVPEPGSLLFLGTGLTGLAGMVRRRFKK